MRFSDGKSWADPSKDHTWRAWVCWMAPWGREWLAFLDAWPTTWDEPA